MGVERVSLNDMTEFATETPTGPRQIAAILHLATPVHRDLVRTLFNQRLVRVPRLRQRLVSTPLGLGPPIWVDDAAFDISRHLTEYTANDPDAEAEALQVAATTAVDPLPRHRPLWALILLTDAAGGCHTLILVLHHALADGIGGLAALIELLDNTTSPAPPTRFPLPAPSRTELLSDATARRWRSLRSLPTVGRNLRAGIAELRGRRRAPHHGMNHSPRTSLNRPIGRRRQLATVRISLPAAAAAAHRHQATINDVLLAAVAGALHATLQARGECAGSFVISVPVSARRRAADGQLGNQVGVIPITVPAIGGPNQRLAAIAAAGKTNPVPTAQGTSAAVLGVAFRTLARLGTFGWFINRQRLVTTFVTNLHGPQAPVHFAGSKISDLIAISPIAGNITVAFAAISYAGTLTVTVITDPDNCPNLDILVPALQQNLEELTGQEP